MKHTSLPPSRQMACRRPILWCRAGFSLVELLLVVALVSTLVSVAYVSFSGLAGAGSEAKLRRDVAAVNAAVRAHALSGGAKLPWDMDGVGYVLAQLKREARSEDKDSTIGLTNALIDRRLAFVLQTDEEAAESGLRVLWNRDEQLFVIADSGPKGIREFYLDDALADDDFGSEVRRTAMEFAREDAWIWDFDESVGGAPRAPSQIGSTTPPTAQPSPPTPPGRLPLEPPTYSAPGGEYPLFDFENFILTLGNPNPPGTSEILFAVNDGPFTFYGGPIFLEPGSEIRSYAHSIDPDHWTDSAGAVEVYTALPVDLELAMVFEQDSFSYPELGGEVQGAGPSLATPFPGTIDLLHQDQIPARFINSANFDVLRTYDGSDPLASGTALAVGAFAGGFPPQPVPLSFAQWPVEAESLTVSVAAFAHNAAIFRNSAVTTRVLNRRTLTVPPPVIAPDPGVLEVDDTVTLTLDIASGIIPPGAEIYYTTDGTDPGAGPDGRPLRGTPYTEPFVLFTDDRFEATVVARAYAPAGMVGWYVPSAPVEAAFEVDLKISSSLWAIADKEGAKLFQVQNYRTAGTARVYEWGEIVYSAGATQVPLAPAGSRSSVEAMAITAAGKGYFVENAPVTIGGVTWKRPVFSIDIAAAVPGEPVVAEPVGDLGPVLETYAGSLGGAGADAVTGLAISPEGRLFGIYADERIADPGTANYLFRVEALTTDAQGAFDDVTFVGRLGDGADVVTGAGDIAFSGAGVLYVADDHSNSVFEVDQDTAELVASISNRTSSSYQALAVDPEDGVLVASNVSGDSANELVGVVAGNDNDTGYFNYATGSGVTNIRAMGFWTEDLADPIPAPVPSLYAVADGDRNIYHFDPGTGTSSVLAADAPFALNSLAHDIGSGRLYFVEDAAANFRLGRYDIATATFTDLGSLQAPGLGYRPSVLPQNLVFWCDSLWYIAADSDDLVRIGFRADGSIARQQKVADMSMNTTNFGTVGDIVADAEGTMRFVDGAGQLYSYSIPNKAALQALSLPGEPVRALVLDASGNYFAALEDALLDHRIYAMNGNSGVTAFLANTRPTRRFWDFAWGHSGTAVAVGPKYTTYRQPVAALADAEVATRYYDFRMTVGDRLAAPSGTAEVLLQAGGTGATLASGQRAVRSSEDVPFRVTYLVGGRITFETGAGQSLNRLETTTVAGTFNADGIRLFANAGSASGASGRTTQFFSIAVNGEAVPADTISVQGDGGNSTLILIPDMAAGFTLTGYLRHTWSGAAPSGTEMDATVMLCRLRDQTIFDPSADPCTNPDPVELAAPVINPDFDAFELFRIRPVIFGLVNPNRAGRATVRYRLNGGAWVTLGPGGRVTLPKEIHQDGVVVEAQAISAGSPDFLPSRIVERSFVSESLNFAANSSGAFRNPQGVVGMITNLLPGQSGPLFNWGTPPVGYDKGSLYYSGGTTNNITTEGRFAIGTMNYHNGTIYTGTEAETVDLRVSLSLNINGRVSNPSFDFTFQLINTLNTDDPWASADYVHVVNPVSSQTIVIDDYEFEFHLEFGESTSNGFSEFDNFHVLENANAVVNVYGNLVQRRALGEELLVREAEDGVITGSKIVIGSDANASGGRYIHSPNGQGGSATTDYVTYEFTVVTPGTYRIKGNVYAASGSDDSFFVRVPGKTTGDGYLWDTLLNTSYAADYVNNRNVADPVEIALTAGTVRVQVAVREDGTRLDKIALERQ